MKLRANNEEVEIIGLDQVQSIDFGIRDEDQGMILEFLRSKMYEDPIGSICREIACNSRDANREAGRGSKPIVISIESGYYSEGETTISFIDSGVGISPERMGEIFCNYGASTKRTSNKLTGGFGLGAKTPFSYSDVFFVETIFEHIKYVYQATLDGKNGKMILLNQEECKDRNGTSITIPIKDKDRNTFEGRCKHYTQYWKVKPDFQNFRSHHTGITTFNTYETFSIYSKDGGMGNLFLLIDEIPYPVNGKMFEELSMNTYSNYAIGLDFPNGELSVSVNRETLYYDEHTIKKIRKRILKVKEECKTIIQEYIETKENRWEAYKAMQNVDSHFSFFKIIKMEVEYNNTYKGDKLIDPRTPLKNFIQKDYIRVKMTTHTGYTNSGQSIRNYITKDDNYNHFDLSPTGTIDKILFIIMDGRRDYKKDHYVASLMDEQGYKVYIWKDFQMNVWRRDVYNQFDRFMEVMDFYGFNWINYSDIPQANIKKASDKKEKSQELKYICLDYNGEKTNYIRPGLEHNHDYETVRVSYEFDKVVIDEPFEDKEFFYMVVDKFTEVGAYKADHTNKELKKLCNINYQLRDVENTGKKRYISKTDFPFVILIKKKDEQYFINNPNAIPFESLLKCEEYRQFRLDRTLKRQIGEVLIDPKEIPQYITTSYSVSNNTMLKFFSLFEDIKDEELKEFLNTVKYSALPDLKGYEEDLLTTVEQSLRVHKLKEFVKDKIKNKTVQAYYLLFINSDEDDTETRDFLIEKLKNI